MPEDNTNKSESKTPELTDEEQKKLENEVSKKMSETDKTNTDYRNFYALAKSIPDDIVSMIFSSNFGGIDKLASELGKKYLNKTTSELKELAKEKTKASFEEMKEKLNIHSPEVPYPPKPGNKFPFKDRKDGVPENEVKYSDLGINYTELANMVQSNVATEDCTDIFDGITKLVEYVKGLTKRYCTLPDISLDNLSPFINVNRYIKKDDNKDEDKKDDEDMGVFDLFIEDLFGFWSYFFKGEISNDWTKAMERFAELDIIGGLSIILLNPLVKVIKIIVAIIRLLLTLMFWPMIQMFDGMYLGTRYGITEFSKWKLKLLTKLDSNCIENCQYEDDESKCPVLKKLGLKSCLIKKIPTNSLNDIINGPLEAQLLPLNAILGGIDKVVTTIASTLNSAREIPFIGEVIAAFDVNKIFPRHYPALSPTKIEEYIKERLFGNPVEWNEDTEYNKNNSVMFGRTNVSDLPKVYISLIDKNIGNKPYPQSKVWKRVGGLPESNISYKSIFKSETYAEDVQPPDNRVGNKQLPPDVSQKDAEIEENPVAKESTKNMYNDTGSLQSTKNETPVTKLPALGSADSTNNNPECDFKIMGVDPKQVTRFINSIKTPVKNAIVEKYNRFDCMWNGLKSSITVRVKIISEVIKDEKLKDEAGKTVEKIKYNSELFIQLVSDRYSFNDEKVKTLSAKLKRKLYEFVDEINIHVKMPNVDFNSLKDELKEKLSSLSFDYLKENAIKYGEKFQIITAKFKDGWKDYCKHKWIEASFNQIEKFKDRIVQEVNHPSNKVTSAIINSSKNAIDAISKNETLNKYATEAKNEFYKILNK